MTLGSFDHFYKDMLYADLLHFEDIRLKKISVVKKIFISAAVALVLAAAVFHFNVYFWMCFVAVFVMINFFTNSFGMQDVEEAFKERIINRIIKELNPDLTYYADKYLDSAHFKQSNIFQYHPDRYYGDDYIAGKIDKTVFEMSEIHASYISGLSSRGYGANSYTVMFQGLFFVADFNKNFSGETYVFPDFAEKNLGVLGSWLQSKNKTRPDLIKLEDPEFEKLFVVYGTDQVEARYILSTSLMRRMTEFAKKRGQDVYFSFKNSNIYIGVRYNKRLFKASILNSFIDEAVMREYYNDIAFALSMVDEMNLNTRIWTKQ